VLHNVCYLYLCSSFPNVPAGNWRVVWKVRFERARGFIPAHFKQKVKLGDGSVVEGPAQLFQGPGFIEMNFDLGISTIVKAELFDIESTFNGITDHRRTMEERNEGGVL
jgi:hypothetical protein